MDTISVDFGASFTDAVSFSDGKLASKASVPSAEYSHEFIARLVEGQQAVAITGGGAFKKDSFASPSIVRMRKHGVRLLRFNEIDCIAAGAAFLSGKKRMLVVSIGTGTPFVFVDGKSVKHLGGTGVGGGTLEGLCRLLLAADLKKATRFAAQAKSGADLTVYDIMGSGIGRIPRDATASNFGKADGASRQQIAASTFKLVSESIGVAAAMAAKAKASRDVVFVGRVAANPVIRKRLAETTRMFGGIRAVFPEMPEYCTAIGAALLSSGKK